MTAVVCYLVVPKGNLDVTFETSDSLILATHIPVTKHMWFFWLKVSGHGHVNLHSILDQKNPRNWFSFLSLFSTPPEYGSHYCQQFYCILAVCELLQWILFSAVHGGGSHLVLGQWEESHRKLPGLSCSPAPPQRDGMRAAMLGRAFLEPKEETLS